MPDAEYKPYTDAMNQTTPQAKAAAIEAYLTAFPQTCAKLDTLVILMQTYYAANDYPKTLDAADRVLQLDPNNLRALLLEAAIRKSTADSVTDPTAHQAALDAGAAAAQKGLSAPKPAAMSDADFKTLQSTAFPFFYSAIGTAALNKKDTATAIDAFKKELAAVPLAQTQAPGPILQDTYFLALAYLQSTPPDLLDCAFYAARFVDYAPEPYKSQIAPTAKYCYRKYHGNDDGYDAAVAASAKANLVPPPDFQASVKPAPTPKDIIDQLFATTPDPGTLAVGDKEYVIQNGTPDQAAKVWDTVKGKSVEIPGALIIAATPAQLQVAISDDAVQSKTADFTFNLAPVAVPEEPEKPSAKATPPQLAAYKTRLAAYKKKVADAQKDADAITAATKVGATVTLDGTYDSFTSKPLMIIMSDGAVVLPKAAKPAAATVHHTAPAHK
jgi:tetratricopeptide (TPR) repeat protein